MGDLTSQIENQRLDVVQDTRRNQAIVLVDGQNVGLDGTFTES